MICHSKSLSKLLQKMLILIKFPKISFNNQADDVYNSAPEDFWA